MDKVRIGFVGAGAMGQCAHLKNYATLPDCEVVALAEIRENLGKRVAARYNVPHVYREAREMLERERLDGIVAAQQFTRHGTLIPELLEARVPLFIEKPLAGSVAMGEKILDALEKSSTWIMVGYHKRSDPSTMYAKRVIDSLNESQELGKLRYVRITMPAGEWVAGGFNDLIDTGEPYPELTWDPPDPTMDTDTYNRHLSFVNYYIHQINLMRHLMGEDYTVNFTDNAGVLLTVESDGGITGIIEMTPYQTTVDWQESALVAFERGYMLLELPAPMIINRAGTVTLYKDPGDGKTPELIVPEMPHVHAMRQQAINFIRAIRSEIPPLCTAAEALKDLINAREYIDLSS